MTRVVLRVCLVGYILISVFLLLLTYSTWKIRLFNMPNPANPAFYLSAERSESLLDMAEYMKDNSVELAFIGHGYVDATLASKMKQHRLRLVQIYEGGVIEFGFYSGRVWYRYFYGEDVDDYVANLTEGREWVSLKLTDDWYFVSTRKSRNGVAH